MTATTVLKPLHTLLESTRGRLLPLPPRLSRLYGNFRVPAPGPGVQVFTNFVSTLDGVVSLQVKGHSGGGDISGFSVQDRMVMGLVRATADVIMIGSGSLDADPHHVWTPEAICPELARDYRLLRKAMAKTAPFLNVVVSASGNVDLRLPVFASGRVAAMIVTTAAGARRLAARKLPRALEIRVARASGGEIKAGTILREITRAHPGRRILVEGGPRLLGSFYAEGLIGEQFLTLAPQIAGRDAHQARLSLVTGQTFAPRHPLWGTLEDVRHGDGLLFLRYGFRGLG
jgi:riboflavin biosynthesis pyrimidine reductase